MTRMPDGIGGREHDNRDPEPLERVLGTAVEPAVRTDLRTDGSDENENEREERRGRGERNERDGRYSGGEGRRFRCATRGCEATKWVSNPPARVVEHDIRTGCSACDAITRHVPDHGRPLAYYERSEAEQQPESRRI